MQVPTPDTLRLWSALLAAHRHLTTELDAELRERVGLTLEEYDVLYQARRADRPLGMSELAGRLLISRPTATRVVDRLVRRGWLERWHDDLDRRVVLVALSDAGRRAQRRAGHVHLDGIARLVGRPLRGRDVRGLAVALAALAPDGDHTRVG